MRFLLFNATITAALVYLLANTISLEGGDIMKRAKSFFGEGLSSEQSAQLVGEVRGINKAEIESFNFEIDSPKKTTSTDQKLSPLETKSLQESEVAQLSHVPDVNGQRTEPQDTFEIPRDKNDTIDQKTETQSSPVYMTSIQRRRELGRMARDMENWFIDRLAK
jgi:hypothetical protein